MQVHRVLVLLLAVALIAPNHALSQVAGHKRAKRIPLWVAASDAATQPYLLRTVVGHGDVLVVPTATDVLGLEAAINGVLLARSAKGDQGSGERLHIRGSNSARSLPWASRVEADLRKVGVRQMPGIGHVRAVRIFLPPQDRPTG